MGNSLVVHWLGLCTLTAEGPDSIPDQEQRPRQAFVDKNKTELHVVFTIKPHKQFAHTII